MNESVRTSGEGPVDEPVSRRGFLKYAVLGFAGLATAAGVVVPIVAYLWPPKQAGAAAGGKVNVASVADLPPNTGKVYSVANKPVIVINAADGYHALSAVCTHLGCIVFWNEQKQAIACPCHAAFFTTNGAVISGPPPAPLATYPVQVQGDQIYVQAGGA
jgi:cytochrome b6-f complex iron-sulfur subunit